MGASRCSCLNYMQHLPSRSPGIPGMFLPHQVLRSFDQLHFEVLPHTPRVLIWRTSIQDLQLQWGTPSSPSCTADYNPALGCHLHTLLHWWELAFSLILNTPPTIGNCLQQGLGHARPPETFFHQTQCAVSALVSCATVKSIDGGLPVPCWNNKDRCWVIAISRGALKIQEIILNGEFLWVGSIEAFLIFRCYSG